VKRLAKMAPGLVVLLILGAANAGNQFHYAAAERFYDTTNIVDVNAITNQIVSAMIARSPELMPHKSILLNFMLEIITY